jgi:uncharacterized protein (DUF4415 family)
MTADVVRDDDNPEWTAADFKRARDEEHLLPPEVRALIKRPRGRPKLDVTKTAVKLRLDPDVVEAFKSTGPGWQSRMNDALRRAAKL